MCPASLLYVFFFFFTFISFYLDLALSLSIHLQQWRWHCLNQGLWLVALLNKAHPVDLPNSAVSINPSSSLLHFFLPVFTPYLSCLACFNVPWPAVFVVQGAMYRFVSDSTHVSHTHTRPHTQTHTRSWSVCFQPHQWLHALCWIKAPSGEIPRLNWWVSALDGLPQPGNLTCLINLNRQICF